MFQQYPGDEYEMEDKMLTWIDDEMKDGTRHKDNRVDKSWLPLEIGRGG